MSEFYSCYYFYKFTFLSGKRLVSGRGWILVYYYDD